MQTSATVSDMLRVAGAQATLQGGRAGKKRGRPIAYRGDPQAAGLSEDEVRRIRRRVANRESARRVRQKRQELMEEQQAQVGGGRSPALACWLYPSILENMVRGWSRISSQGAWCRWGKLVVGGEDIAVRSPCECGKPVLK